MKRQVYGMVADIEKVISRKSERCDKCQHETEKCTKLFVTPCTLRTVCVKLK
jgi:hypothetical protein